MQGKHGKGWCYQTEVATDDEIGLAIKKIYRATPNIIFVGELRDGSAVKEAIAAGNSGHLVVATSHASDLISGMSRLVSLAGDGVDASDLADAFRVGIHLTLRMANQKKNNSPLSDVVEKGTGSPPRVLSLEALWMTGQADEGLRSIVRAGDFHKLTSEIERQRRSFMSGFHFS